MAASRSIDGMPRAISSGPRAERLIVLGRCVLLGLALVISAASFSGFYAKWGFRNELPRLSLDAMLDGNASRPFAYRRLVVDAVNLIDREAPSRIKDGAKRVLRMSKFHFAFPEVVHNDSSKALRFELVYVITYLSVVALLLASYRFAKSEGLQPIAAGIGATIFIILFPMLMSNGGYFYDYLESFFFVLFLLLARKGCWPAMLLVALLATWNKESFFFFALTAFPLLRERKSLLASAMIIAASIAIAGLTYEMQRIRFAANAGAATESHIAEQLHYFMAGTFLLQPEVTYGLPLPHPFSLPWILAIGIASAIGWRFVTAGMRQQIVLAAVINIPLFLLFCAAGETRNLSMLFPGLLVLTASGFQAAALQGGANCTEEAN